jgi:hypothetical protein
MEKGANIWQQEPLSVRAEATVPLDANYCSAVVTVQLSRPLADAIEKVWLVPASRRSPAAQK